MVDLFVGRVLVKNNRARDPLDSERELVARLQNKLVALFFGSGDCGGCRAFAPRIADFYTRLTDERHVERSAQLVLLYVSLDASGGGQEEMLRALPRRCLFLTFEDPYRRELEEMFRVRDLPTVVVLRPDGSVLTPDATREIRDLGPDCYQNWREAAELVDRAFTVNEEYEESRGRSLTGVIRGLKYRVEEDEEERRRRRGRGGGGAEGGRGGEEEGGGGAWG